MEILKIAYRLHACFDIHQSMNINMTNNGKEKVNSMLLIHFLFEKKTILRVIYSCVNAHLMPIFRSPSQAPSQESLLSY